MPKSRNRQRAGDGVRPPSGQAGELRMRCGTADVLLPPEFDAVIESDRRFFARRSDRSYRVRHTAPIEMRVHVEMGQAFVALFPGTRWFTAVRQVSPGYRIRGFYQSFHDAEIDLSEELSRALYDAACGPEGQQMAVALERVLRDVRGRQ